MWRQWNALGATGGASDAPRTTLDPEALVLASTLLLDRERRLGDFLLWWANTGACLLSVQRTRSLLKVLPGTAAESRAPFAASAVQAGDRRWKSLAGPRGLDARPGKGTAAPMLTTPAALVLRLRAAFGVSAKADVIALLLGLERAATVRDIAEAAGYTTVAVRSALSEVALAGFATETGATPTAYRATRREAWTELLNAPPLAWGFWAERYAVLLDIAAWGAQAEARGWSAYVASSKARDLTERHARAFRRWVPNVQIGRPGSDATASAIRAILSVLGASSTSEW